MKPSEERDASGNLAKQFLAQGQTLNGNDFYFTKDHLGSIREMTNATGVIQAQYQYDPYGQVSKVQGTQDADFEFDGYYFHRQSGLNLARMRAYSGNLGRWISRDMLGLAAGPNQFAYVFNNPINKTDTSGLDEDTTQNNCMGYSCGENRTPQSPHGHFIAPDPGQIPNDFFKKHGFTCTLLNKGEKCEEKCKCAKGAMVVIFYGAPGAGPKDPMNTALNPATTAIHTAGYEIDNNAGWTNVPGDLPLWYEPESIDPYTWTPEQHEGYPATEVWARYCCCKDSNQPK